MGELTTLALVLFLALIAYALVVAVLHTLSSYYKIRIEAYDQVRKGRELRQAYLRSIAERGRSVDQRA